jgi:hypothetical protein
MRTRAVGEAEADAEGGTTTSKKRKERFSRSDAAGSPKRRREFDDHDPVDPNDYQTLSAALPYSSPSAVPSALPSSPTGYVVSKATGAGGEEGGTTSKKRKERACSKLQVEDEEVTDPSSMLSSTDSEGFIVDQNMPFLDPAPLTAFPHDEINGDQDSVGNGEIFTIAAAAAAADDDDDGVPPFSSTLSSSASASFMTGHLPSHPQSLSRSFLFLLFFRQRLLL